MNMEIVQSLRTPAPLIDETMVKDVVEAFYARIRRHPTLGPVLDGAIGDHWPEYLSKMQDYWTSVLLDTGRYHGNPILAHRQHKAIRPKHFDLWLAQWRETVRDLCPPRVASEFIRKAEGIGASLKFNLYENLESPIDDDFPPRADLDFAKQQERDPVSKKQPITLNAPASEIHPCVFAYVLGAYVWMLFSLLMALKSDGGAVFMVAISTFFLAMYAGIPFALNALGRKHSYSSDNKTNDFGAFLDKKISTYTGTLTGRDVMLQITIIPILLAIGMTAIAFIIVHAQS
jgi:hemoglobin